MTAGDGLRAATNASRPGRAGAWVAGEQHLDRYLAEFDFRQNHRVKLGYSDDMRTDKALEGIKGKRLTYRRTNKAADGEAEGSGVPSLA